MADSSDAVLLRKADKAAHALLILSVRADTLNKIKSDLDLGIKEIDKMARGIHEEAKEYLPAIADKLSSFTSAWLLPKYPPTDEVEEEGLKADASTQPGDAAVTETIADTSRDSA